MPQEHWRMEQGEPKDIAFVCESIHANVRQNFDEIQ